MDATPSFNETPKAAAAFHAYCAYGTDRSLAKVCQKLGRKPNYVVQLQEWSSRYAWVDRAKQYDDDQRAQSEAEESQRRKRKQDRDRKREEQREKMDDDRSAVFRAEWAKVLKAINDRLESGDTKGLVGLTTLLSRSLDEERQSLGGPTQSIAITGADGGPMQVQFVLPVVLNEEDMISYGNSNTLPTDDH